MRPILALFRTVPSPLPRARDIVAARHRYQLAHNPSESSFALDMDNNEGADALNPPPYNPYEQPGAPTHDSADL